MYKYYTNWIAETFYINFILYILYLSYYIL